jgi:hypothetical protein
MATLQWSSKEGVSDLVSSYQIEYRTQKDSRWIKYEKPVRVMRHACDIVSSDRIHGLAATVFCRCTWIALGRSNARACDRREQRNCLYIANSLDRIFIELLAAASPTQ